MIITKLVEVRIGKTKQFIIVDVATLSAGSKVKVVARCDDCGVDRTVHFRDYRPKCKSCARKKYRTNECEDCGTPCTLTATKCRKCSDASRLVNKCSDCGTKVQTNATRCRKCFDTYRAENPQSQISCSKCGKERAIRGSSRETTLLCRKCYEESSIPYPNCKVCGNTIHNKYAEYHRDCWYKSNVGEAHSNYNNELANEDRADRRVNEDYSKWQFLVKERYDFKCDICGDTKSRLASHHLLAYSVFKEERYNIDNGVCLCESCHIGFHKEYGFKGFTDEDYTEFKINQTLGAAE